MGQGLTLVHFSAQLQRFLWDSRRIEGLFRGSLKVSGDVQDALCTRDGSD